MRCTKCGMTIPNDSGFCQYCGEKIETHIYCKYCGTILTDNMVFCPECGNKAGDFKEDVIEAILPDNTVIEENKEIEEYVVHETIERPDEIIEPVISEGLPAEIIEPVVSDEFPNDEPILADSITSTNVNNKSKSKKTVVFAFIATLLIACLGLGAFLFNGDSVEKVSIPELAQSVLYLELYDQNEEIIGSASGFLIDDGVLVTNYHVIEDTYSITAWDPAYEECGVFETVLAYDEEVDLAILKGEDIQGIKKFELANSSLVKQGDKIYVVGYPLGLNNTLSEGNVSSLYDMDTYELIQVTAPISQGNSGGVVLNGDGEVIGVTRMYIEEGQLLNYAVASNDLKSLYNSANNNDMLLSELFPYILEEDISDEVVNNNNIQDSIVVGDGETTDNSQPADTSITVVNTDNPAFNFLANWILDNYITTMTYGDSKCKVYYEILPRVDNEEYESVLRAEYDYLKNEIILRYNLVYDNGEDMVSILYLTPNSTTYESLFLHYEKPTDIEASFMGTTTIDAAIFSEKSSHTFSWTFGSIDNELEELYEGFSQIMILESLSFANYIYYTYAIPQGLYYSINDFGFVI